MLNELAVSETVPADTRAFLATFYTLTERPTENTDWQLDFIGDCYQLSHTREKQSLILDFRTGNYRHRNQNLGKEPLLKAIKIKQKLPKTLIDTTPGVLKDSFMLAGRGIKITAIERNPILYVMVKKSLSLIEHPIDYQFGDAGQLLFNYLGEVIYLDPMYPPKKKSAQVKKDMQILHQIIGADSDANELLHSTRQHAKTIQSRVVVKRPTYAEPLGNEKPSFTSQTGNTRFDIYLP